MGVWTTKSIRKIRKNLKKKPSFLKDLFFPRTETVENEEIHLETTANGNAMAPFVSPVEDGRVMKDKGKITNIIIAPNIAPKNILDPKDLFEREVGDPEQGRKATLRSAKKIGRILATQEENITNKEEFMAGQFLSTGKITSVGEENAYEIDYKMTNIGTLGTGKKWSDSGVNALTDLDKIISDSEEFGEKVEAVVMDAQAADAFFNNKYVKDALDTRNLFIMDATAKSVAPGVAYLGFYAKRGVKLYQYDRSVSDKFGNKTPIIPAGTIIGGPTSGEILHAPIVYFNEKGSDVHEVERYSRIKVSSNGKQKSITTESRPVYQPKDMSGYFSWKVV